MEDRMNLGRNPTPERLGGVDIEREKLLASQHDQAGKGAQAMRERTVAEMLDSKIWGLQSQIRGIERLRESMTVSMLSSGCSQIEALLK